MRLVSAADITRSPVGAALVLLGAALAQAPSAVAARPACPSDMARVGRACIDRYEGSLVRLDERGRERGAHSPFFPVGGARVKARSRAGVSPQAYITQREAASACAEAGKRLCTDEEWLLACRGQQQRAYPYGPKEKAGRCNDHGVSPLLRLHGKPATELFTFELMNDPRLNQVPGSLAKTGRFRRCKNPNGVADLVGNLHEWTADPSGTFRGGYYLDTHLNGDGCQYVTRAHSPNYRDYSIGFRCCAEQHQRLRPPKAPPQRVGKAPRSGAERPAQRARRPAPPKP